MTARRVGWQCFVSSISASLRLTGLHMFTGRAIIRPFAIKGSTAPYQSIPNTWDGTRSAGIVLLQDRNLAASPGLCSVLSPFHISGEHICLLFFLSFFLFPPLPPRQIPAPKKGIAEHSAQLSWKECELPEEISPCHLPSHPTRNARRKVIGVIGAESEQALSGL